MAEAETPIWTPKVVKRKHPYGEEGVRSSLEEVAKKAALGSVDPRVRAWSIECLERARQKGEIVTNPRGRAIVLLEAVQKKLWVPDPVGSEFINGAHLTACVDKNAPCFHGGDCFPEGAFLLAEGHELMSIETIKPGMRIWGLDRWSEVEAVKYKGVLPIDVVTLNNGSELKLTGDHHVYVLECPEHPDGHRKVNGRTTCSCAVEKRIEKRIRVSELEVGMVLPQPKRLPFGENKHADAPESHEQAYVEGLYVSDGWADYQKNGHFSISGQDGCPKEQQKQEVQSICEGLGVPTRWARKYITIKNKAWTLRVQRMGHYAPEKHLLTLDLDEANAAASLRGVMADSGKNTRGEQRTFTTTSWLLAVQMRVLHRMFGVSCGWRYIENHGGLGKNPIWRLGTRGNSRVDGRKPWLLRVRKIERELISVPCWDIQTDDHRVYLPEYDVTVAQCDDLTALLASSFASVGLYTMIVGQSYDHSRSIGHVLCAVWIDGRWYYADPSTKLPLGQCVTPFTRERCLSFPNVKVVCDENACLRSPTRFDPERNHFVEQGVFVGVDGPPVLIESPVQWLGHQVQWLGQESDEIGDQTWVAFTEEAEKRNYGTTDEDLEAYGTTAGAVAATGACAAAGAAVVAPLCGYVGGKVGGYIVSLFTSHSDEQAKIHAEQAAAWDQWEKAWKVDVPNAYQRGVEKIIADLNNLLHFGTPPQSPADPKEVMNYFKGDTGVGFDEDNFYLGLDGPGGSITWRMIKMFEWGKRFNAASELPLGATSWPGTPPPPPGTNDNVNVRSTFVWVIDQYTDWIARSIYCGGTLAQVEAGQCIGSIDASYVTSGKWKERLPLAQDRLQRSLKGFSSALGAATAPQIAQAAAIRASRENPPSRRSGSIVRPALVTAAAGAALWWAYTTL